MKPDKSDKKIDDLISRAIGREKPTFNFNKWQAEHQKEIQTYKAQVKKPSDSVESSRIWRTIMKNPITKLAAAVIIIVILGGINFWPDSSENRKWWLAPPAAWGQEIIESLEDFEVLVYREQFVHISLYGSTHVSGQWSINYQANDRSRQDTYFERTDEDTYGDNTEDSVLHHITWKIPEGNDLIHYDVSSEFQC
ncbi:MAG: hypothetical protein ACYSUY_03875, partial [Planctomycetota bacterium]